jgi:hypothetical protein
MLTGPFLMFLLSAYPMGRAWQANRKTSLFQAMCWAIAAWAAWGVTLALAVRSADGTTDPVASYTALCLTGCAGIAVLGARRPGVGAWNFVLAGLLAVMFLPLVENAALQKPLFDIDPLRYYFLAATVALGLVNYLPTRLAIAAIFLGAGCTTQFFLLTEPPRPATLLAWWPIPLTPWLGFFSWRLARRPSSEFDRIWLDFRNRFGFLWGQRLREQLNRSAANAGWPIVLRWQGIRLLPGTSLPDAAIQDAILETLRALLKRFTSAE